MEQQNQSNEAQPADKRPLDEDVEEAQPLPPPPLRRSTRNKPSAFAPYSYDIQRFLVDNFLDNFDMAKQIQLRAVSHLFEVEVKRNCSLVKALILVLKNDEIDQAQEDPLKLLIRSELLSCRINWDEKDNGITIAPSQVKVLSILETHWNSDTIESIGQLFRNVKYLNVIDEIAGTPPDLDKYSALWSMLPRVENLILRISGENTGNDFLGRLFGAIEDHLAPLEALNVQILAAGVFPRLELRDIEKTTRFMRSFALGCSVVNLHKILQMVGRDLCTKPRILPIRELEMHLTFGVQLIGPMFERNPALAQVSWLRLYKVADLQVALTLLEHCTALEELWLSKEENSAIRFGSELFTAVSKLAHLQELALVSFDIWDCGSIYKWQQATQIRKISINRHGLFDYILGEWLKNNVVLNGQIVNVEAIFRPFVANVARLFPRLELFHLRTNLKFINKDIVTHWCFQEFKYIQRVHIDLL